MGTSPVAANMYPAVASTQRGNWEGVFTRLATQPAIGRSVPDPSGHDQIQIGRRGGYLGLGYGPR